MNAETLVARGAIEALRSGVPSRHAVSRLGATQEEVVETFRSSLASVAAGHGASPTLVSASFGGGKSHLLNYLRGLAEREGFVCSFVVVGPETPLGNPQVVLKAIAEDARAPGRTGQALRELAADLHTGSAEWAELRSWADGASVDDRFRALLHVYEEFRADEELRARILDDIQGKPLPITEIKKRLREIRQQAEYELRAVRVALLAHDRLRTLARFCRACGCQGLVVLFDELERIRTFSLKQRLAAYHEIGWWTAMAREPGAAILPMFAYADGFVEEVVVGGLDDEAHFGQFAAAGDERDDYARDGIALLRSDPCRLVPPTQAQLEDIRYRVRLLYEEAYGSTAGDVTQRAAVTTVRSEIRRWITEWDLHRHFPDYRPDIVEDEMAHDTASVADDMLAHDGDAEEIA